MVNAIRDFFWGDGAAALDCLSFCPFFPSLSFMIACDPLFSAPGKSVDGDDHSFGQAKLRRLG